MAKASQTTTGGRPATSATIAGDFALSVGTPDRSPPDGWQWTKLTDVARLETGHTPSRKHPEYWDGDIPWIGIKDATANHGRTLFDTLQHTNDLGLANSSARLLPAETVCLSRTASVGYVVVMGRPMATSQDFVNWVCSSDLEHRYLKYVLLAERGSFLRFASGTTHQTIYFPEVKAFHVCLPPLPEQRAIAHILGTLDDKIEVNRTMNETLERMARALFKSWFVDFDPVLAKMEGRWSPGETLPGLPAEHYGLFPDRLVDSEVGEVPEGWEVRPLEDIVSLRRNSVKPQDHPDEVFDYFSIPAFDDGCTPKPERGEAIRSNKYQVPVNGVLISKLNPRIPRVWLPAVSDQRRSICSTEFLVVEPGESHMRPWVYSLFCSDKFQARFSALVTGTSGSHQRVRPNAFLGLRVVVPPRSLRLRFASMAGDFLARIEHARTDSKTLGGLRDALLPQLISGALRIEEAERILTARS